MKVCFQYMFGKFEVPAYHIMFMLNFNVVDQKCAALAELFLS